jgi:hypothetical protein
VLVIAYILALFALGWVITSALTTELHALERFGLAYGIGAGFFSLTVFLTSLIGIPITLISGAIIFVVLFLGFVISSGARNLLLRIRDFSQIRLEMTFFQLVLLSLITIVITITFIIAAYWQPYVWDSLAVWALKAKVIAATGALADLPRTGWAFYPLNISLQITFLYLLGGNLLQLIFPMYLLSLAALIIANLRERAGMTIALACALFLVVTPLVQFQATIAYANLPVAFYYVSSAIYLVRFLEERKRTWLVISAILVGLAGWTRTEGPLYLAINLVVLVMFVIARSREATTKQSPNLEIATLPTVARNDMIKDIALYIAIFLLLWSPWTIYARLANYGDYFGFTTIGITDALSGKFDFARLGTIIDYLGQRVIATQDWGLLWLALPVAFILGIKNSHTHAPIIALIVLNILALIYTYYVASAQTYFSVDWWLNTGFDRMTLQFLPLNVYYLGLVVSHRN